jgi:hypothetical protein
MSHNPNTVKSQDELNEGGRKSDVLLSTIEELERTKKQLDIAVAGLQYYANEDIYIESHKVVNGNNEWTSEVMLDNGIKASYFLKKIKELNK